MADPIELDAERIVEVLNDHEVAYVVIGGFAALLHGSPRTTQDLDITPSVDPSNLARLAAALRVLEAQLLAPDSPPVPWRWDAAAFAQFTTGTTRTRWGDLDICLRPDAPGGQQFTYDDLAVDALVIRLPPDIPVASLADVIASKEASGRDKDRGVLPELRALQQEIAQQRPSDRR